jgi:general secretion pathway protein D
MQQTSQVEVAPVVAKREPNRIERDPPVQTRPTEPLPETVPVRPNQTLAQETLPPPPESPQLAEASQQEQQPAPAQGVEMPLLKEPGMADEMITVNFDGVDIRDVLKTVGELTGINFIPHESVSGPVTVMSPTAIRLGDLYSLLQSVLDVHGYAAIETTHAVKVVPKAEATKSSLQVRFGADPAYIPKNDAIITQVMPLQYADVDDVKQIIQPILSGGAQMATYARTNSLMVTDTSANVHYIAQIIQRVDVEGSRERVSLFPLRHASAQVLSDQITRILDKAQGAVVSATRGRTAQSPAEGPKVLPDDRTNSLIVVADEQDIDMVGQLVKQLDIERPSGTDNIHVLPLKNADANEVAPSLEAAMASMRLTGTVEATQQIHITPDGSTNSLIVVASPQDYQVINKIVEKLDIVREQVLVEMMILEVTEEGLKEIGVDWATLDEAVADSIRGFGVTNLGPRVDFISGDYEGLAVGAWKGSGDNVQIGAILQALHKESAVNILSTPHILTSNHRRAKIIVGENRAFVTQSRITETTDFITPTVIQGYEYKDVGITLEITPHVNQGGLIRLELDTEFTKLIEDVSAPSADTPTTAKRTAQTIVTMNSGATVVIGGLMRDDKTRIKTKVPLAGDLPLLGPLFRSQRDQTQKTNLLILITPRVMTSEEELQKMTDEKRQEMSSRLEQSR